MKKYQRGLMAATLALCSYVAIPAQAEVLNIPVSAALMNSNSLGSGCQIGPVVVTADLNGGSCSFGIPLTVPTGHTIQQIAVVYTTSSNPSTSIHATLEKLDFVAPMESTQFDWSSDPSSPPDVFQVKRLMAQTKYGAFPDAFLVQPNTTYQVLINLFDGALGAGLQVTYQ